MTLHELETDKQRNFDLWYVLNDFEESARNALKIIKQQKEFLSTVQISENNVK